MQMPITRRSLSFFAAFFMAGVIACLHTYSQAVETGVLRLGGRNPAEFALANAPESFYFWLNFTLVAAGFCTLLALVSMWAAWRMGPTKGLK